MKCRVIGFSVVDYEKNGIRKVGCELHLASLDRNVCGERVSTAYISANVDGYNDLARLYDGGHLVGKTLSIDKDVIERGGRAFPVVNAVVVLNDK